MSATAKSQEEDQAEQAEGEWREETGEGGAGQRVDGRRGLYSALTGLHPLGSSTYERRRPTGGEIEYGAGKPVDPSQGGGLETAG